MSRKLGREQLRVGADRHPRPGAPACGGAFFACAAFFSFGVNELPDFVYLDSRKGQVPEGLILPLQGTEK